MLENLSESQDTGSDGAVIDNTPSSAIYEGGPPSGGPRTPEGKQTSSKNAIKHGILSPSPVAGGEILGEWDVFLEGIRDHFKPVGAYEEELVYRITHDLWCLRRVDGSATALIDIRYHEIDDPEPAQSGFSSTPSSADYQFHDARTALATLDAWNQLEDTMPLSDTLVDDIMIAILGPGASDPELEQIPDSLSAGVSSCRNFIAAIAGVRGEPEAMVISCARQRLSSSVQRQANRERAQKKRRANRAARGFLPDDPNQTNFDRYRTTFERGIERKLKWLEDSQRARANDLPAPIRLQVTEV